MATIALLNKLASSQTSLREVLAQAAADGDTAMLRSLLPLLESLQAVVESTPFGLKEAKEVIDNYRYKMGYKAVPLGSNG